MNNFLKFISISLLSIFSINTVYAVTPGIYVGAGIGYSKLNDFQDATSDQGGVGGKLVLGYNFNKFVGVEAGYTHFATSNYSYDDGYISSINYDLNAATLALKGYMPINSSLEFYGLIGVAEMYAKATTTGYFDINESRNDFAALAGLGLNYRITPKVSANLEYTTTSDRSSNDENIGIPFTNLVTLGLAYHFN